MTRVNRSRKGLVKYIMILVKKVLKSKEKMLKIIIRMKNERMILSSVINNFSHKTVMYLIAKEIE